MDERQKNILSRLEAQCARREYCTKDIRAKALKYTEGDAAAAEEIVAALLEDKYVDDSRYAAAFAREKSSLTGWGPVKIRFALSAKGIDAGKIADALGEIDSGESGKKLESLLRTKWRSVAGEKDCKLRLLKYALGRGYQYDEVAPIVEKIISEGKSEEGL
jgi:regulatory protein